MTTATDAVLQRTGARSGITGRGVPLRPALVVLLGGELFGVGLRSVDEVSRPPALTRVPRAPGWLAGVANHRGRVLPVADVRADLGLATPDASGRRARCVLLRGPGEVLLGLRTEGVRGVVGLPEQLEAVPPGVPGSAQALLRGTAAATDRGPLPVLDVPALLDLSASLRVRG